MAQNINDPSNYGEMASTDKQPASALPVQMATYGMKIVKYEQFNPTVMTALLKHENIGADDKKRLQAYHKRKTNGNVVEVKYDYPKNYKQGAWARVYAEKGLGLQQIPADIRNALGKDYYFDVDMKNAHPTILLQICKNNMWSCPNLEKYVANRDDILKEVGTTLNVSAGEAKGIMTKLLYLGGVTDTRCTFLTDYRKEMLAIANNVKNAYPEIYNNVTKKRTNEHDKLSTCLSFVLSTEEHKCLMCMNNCFERNGRNVDVLIYDGCWVKKLPNEQELDGALLSKVEACIKEEEKYDIKLAVKPMTTTMVFSKTAYELEQERRQQENEELYDTMNYDYLKVEFERSRFKVMNPICYCEATPDGRLIIRQDLSMSSAYKNKKMMTRTAIIDPATNEPIAGKFNYATEGFIAHWMFDADIRTYDEMDMFPPPLECPEKTYNLWNGFAIQRSFAPSSGNVEPFINHMKIMVNHNQESFDYIIKWLASIFQKPAELQGTAIVLRGEQGAGKGAVVENILFQIIGVDKTFATCDPTKDIFSRFSIGRFLKILINIDETNGKESCANSEPMKRSITAPTYNHEEKGGRPFTVRNFTRFLFTTNNNNPVKAEQGDRRYMIEDTSSEKFGDKDYFNGLFAYANNECNLKAIYDYLMSIDLTGINWITDRPKNEAYQSLQSLYVDASSKFLINVCKLCVKSELVKSGKELYDMFDMWCEKNIPNRTSAVLSPTMFGVGMGRLAVDALSGVVKTRSAHGVVYKVNVDMLREYYTKRNTYDLEYNFQSFKFLKCWCGRDECE